MGTNGAGKTTTLKMITNLCAKDKGEIVIDKVSLDRNPGLALSKVGAALDTPSFYLNRWTFTYEHQKVPPGELLIGISVMVCTGSLSFGCH